MRDSSLDVPPLLKRHAQLQVRGREPRRERDGLAEVLSGACELTLLTQYEPEIVIRFSMIRTKPDR